MTRDPLDMAYELLDLDEKATAQEALRAYHRKKALYSEGSLATYSLMTGKQREEMLDNIERAYMRISQKIESRTKTPETFDSPEAERLSALQGESESIGSYLKRRREDLGLTLRDVAARTRIRTTYLSHIEGERLTELPAPVYLRGFVLEFARVLDIPDPETITSAYLQLLDKEDN